MLIHSGHFLVVGSTGFSFLVNAINLFIGMTTKKYMTAEIIRNEISALIKSPTKNLLLLTVKVNPEKSGFPPIAPIIGVIISFTKAVTTEPKATPTTTPTAKSKAITVRLTDEEKDRAEIIGEGSVSAGRRILNRRW